jgi:hypothetical protein
MRAAWDWSSLAELFGVFGLAVQTRLCQLKISNQMLFRPARPWCCFSTS